MDDMERTIASPSLDIVCTAFINLAIAYLSTYLLPPA